MRKLAIIIAALSLSSVVGANPRNDVEERTWLPIGVSFITAPIQIPPPSYSVYGVMLDIGYGQVSNSYMLNAGLINNVRHNMGGVQLGTVNLSGNIYGVQTGLVNYASEAYGLQLGVLNMAKHLHGAQIGLVNVNLTGMPVLPILNIGF